MSTLSALPSSRAARREWGSDALRARDRAAIALGRLAGRASRALRTGAGEQMPGRVMLRCSAQLPERLAAGRTVVLVSATNGKSAITTMLTAALRARGHAVASNLSGANMMPGLVTALAAARDAPYAVLETDEAVLPRALVELRPDLVVLGELSRDQLDRHHEVRSVAANWRAAFEESHTAFVAPVNDPNVVWALEGRQVDWVELDTAAHLDAVVCPRCCDVLHRGERAVEWWCACGLAAPVASVTQRGDELCMAGMPAYRGPMVLPGDWQRANRALAVAAAARLDVSVGAAFAAASEVATVGRRVDLVSFGGRKPARLVLVKNPASWTALIDHLRGSDATLVFVQDDRAADGRDPSWLWDVPYERLAPRKAVAAGSRALDVAVRLVAAGLTVVAVEPDACAALAIPDAGDDVVVAASYSAYHEIVREVTRR